MGIPAGGLGSGFNGDHLSLACNSSLVASRLHAHRGSRPKTGVNGAGHRFCFETYQVIEERTYARACTSIAD